MKLRVTVDDQTFEVEVGDLNARPVLATIEDEIFEVWPEETAAEVGAADMPVKPQRVESMPKPVPAAASGNGADKSKAVPAPIPGVLISIAVKPGENVTPGQELCVIEAMKMKNAIRANRAGKISAICAAVGDQVKKGQPLVEYAE